MGIIQDTLEIVRKRNANEPEFLQAVTEVLESIEPAIQTAQEVPGRQHPGADRGAGAA